MKKNTTKIRLGVALIALAILSSTGIVFAQDVHRGYGGHHEKVEICHKGNSIEVAPSAVAGHLRHGDTHGECPSHNKKHNHSNISHFVSNLFGISHQ